MAENKNNMPSFASGSYANIQRLIADKKINAPAFIYLTDRECLAFLDHKAVLHVILWEQLQSINERLEGMNDPETGEPIKVTEYVADTVEPVKEQVDNIEEKADKTEKQVAKISNAITMITSDDIKEVNE